MRTTLRCAMLAAAWLIPAAAWAQITVPPQIDPHKPIVATLTHPLPPGAQVRGAWRVTAADFIEVRPDCIHIWAQPGVHTVTASGVWVVTRDVKIGEEIVPILVDFGQYEHTASFTVGAVVPPVPPPIPPQPVAWALIIEETAERTPAQAALFTALRKAYAGQKLQIVDQSNPPAAYRAYFSAAANVARPALVLIAGDGQVVAAKPCPTTVEAFRRELP